MTSRRGRLAIAGFAVALAVGLAVGLQTLSRARCFALGAPALCRVDTDKPLVALTFDDGPTDLGVDAVLPILAEHHAQATFFLIGEQLARRPDLAARLRAAGHELGNHSYSHRRMAMHSGGFYEREVADTEALLARTGSRSGLFRPPYGKKLLGLPLTLRRHGLTMTMWDVEDPNTKDPAAYAAEVVSKARPGSIILMHPMYPANATAREALPAILQGLRTRGLRAVSVGTLLRETGAP